jgi:hypothetical protein
MELGTIDWPEVRVYLILGTPVWALAVLYVAFRLVPKKGKGATSSAAVSLARIVLVVIAVSLLTLFAIFCLVFDPR